MRMSYGIGLKITHWIPANILVLQSAEYGVYSDS